MPRRWIELSPPVAATICVFALLMIAGMVGRIASTPSMLLQPTPALPIIIIASPLPQGPVPTAVPAPVQVAAVVPENVTQRVIGVFGGPDPATYIGSVEQGRAFVPVARYGVEWTQVDMSGGTGRVFVRTADLYGVPELVDLQPPPTPQVIERPIYVANQPEPAVATPEQYQVAQQEALTPAPQQLVIFDREMWAQAAAAHR